MKIINKKNLNLEFLISSSMVEYKKAINFMEDRVNAIKIGKKNEAIWFLEHPSLYTMGRSFETTLRFLEGIPIHNTGRGGNITWHGPGQKIIYFMIDLKKRNLDIRKFVFNSEKFIIKSLKDLRINSYKLKNLVGIWTKDKNNNDAKIASLGLRVSKGIIYHGLSINVNCNLAYFKKIDPCGIKNSVVTSIFSLRDDISISEVDKVLQNNISYIFI